MNSNSQIEAHPDAEILNAFAEQGLATPERKHVLAHLAGCGRCRQVVYLAQQAATDAEMPARAASATHAKPSQPWFANWRFVWVPAAALAAALALVVTFHPRQAAKAPEIARVNPGSEERIPPPAPRPPEEAKGKMVHPPTPPAVLRPAKSAKVQAKDATVGIGTGSGAGSSYSSLAEPGSLGVSRTEGDVATSAPGVPAPVMAVRADAAQFKPEPAVAAGEEQQRQTVRALSSDGAAAKALDSKLREAAGTAGVNRQTTVAAPTSWSQAAPTPATSYAAAMHQLPIDAAPSANAHKSVKLPSGLAPVSTALVKDRILAVDILGEVFLSTDTGTHWKPVAQQWTGRAIQVRAPKAFSDANSRAVAFELVNDSALTWVSVDGDTWKAK